MHSFFVLPGCQQAAGEETQSQTNVEKHFGAFVQAPRLVETKQYFTWSVSVIQVNYSLMVLATYDNHETPLLSFNLDVYSIGGGK